jgi:signal recognition particle subunit SEC65
VEEEDGVIAMLTEEQIKFYFQDEKVIYSDHSIGEMLKEELGEITVEEIVEAASKVEILNKYPEDKPYPSILALGFTKNARPIHIVCALDEMLNKIVLITVYEPKPELWINNRIRRER